MFFPRLRRQARWVFAFLAAVFAGTFIFLGVGSGGGVGDLLYDGFGGLFGAGSSGQPSISKARDKVRENPGSAQAHRELATAYVADQRNVEAIGALERYLELRPRDRDAVQELASLRLSRADELRQRAAAAYAEQQQASLGQLFGPDPNSDLGRALGNDPLTQALITDSSTRFNDLYTQMQAAYREAVQSYKSLVALDPDDPLTQENLAFAAEVAGDLKTAIGAYKRYLAIAPDDPNAPAIRQKIQQLEAQSALSPSVTGALP